MINRITRSAVLASLLLWLATVLLAVAGPITPRQAQAAAETLITRVYPAPNRALARTLKPWGRSRLAVSQTDFLPAAGSTVGFIVHLQPQGYVLIRTDDCLPAVKMHSEEGAFADLPPVFLRILTQEMAAEVNALRAMQSKGNVPAAHQDWAALAPQTGNPALEMSASDQAPDTVLLSTTWAQGNPYNLYAPTASGGSNGRAVAGCVPVAMAQILRYHSYPPRVLADHSYDDSDGICTGQHSISGAGMQDYDWGNMPNRLTSASPQAQTKAVAQLIFHCGVSVEADFEGSPGTGANSGDVPASLSTYFGYTSSSQQRRNIYSDSEWFSKILLDIDNQRPVYYSFYDENSDGHAVVCDGYRNANEIHINFGWSGNGNAWYNLYNMVYNGDWLYNHRAIFLITPGAQKVIPPNITQSPADVTVPVGGTAVFSVAANGSPPLIYAWQRSGTPIAGANATNYTLYNAQLLDSGSRFSCLVSNAAGWQMSGEAALTVNPIVSQGRLVRMSAPSAAPGGLVCVALEMISLGDENTITFSLGWDSAVLIYDSLRSREEMSGAFTMLNTNNAWKGELGVMLARSAGDTFTAGTNALVDLYFRVSGTVVQAIDSAIQFQDSPVAREVASRDANVLPMDFQNGVVRIQVGLEGDITPRPGGDLRVTAIDYTKLGLIIAGLVPIASLSDAEFMRADCAPRATLGDGRITAADWTQCGRYVLGLDLLVNMGGPRPTAYAIQLIETTPGTAAAERTILGMDTNVAAGASVVLPIRLKTLGGENTVAFSLLFDRQLIVYEGADLGDLPPSTSFLMSTNSANEGMLGVLLALPAGQNLAAGEHELLRLMFRAANNLHGATGMLVRFGDTPIARELVSSEVVTLPAQYRAGTIRFSTQTLTLDNRVSYIGFTIKGIVGRTYQIDWTPDISGASWSAASSVTLTNAAQLWVDSHAPITGNRFYRAVLLP